MKKWIIICTIVLFTICLASFGYVYYIYYQVVDTFEQIYEPIHPNTVSGRSNFPFNKEMLYAEKAHQQNQTPIRILIIGIDEREGDYGRSDVLIFTSIHPSDQSIRMFNIPRDTRVKIIGKDFEDKINHAYAYGSTNTTIKTVEAFLETPIDYYIKINMEGFYQLIDSLEGITINNELEWEDEDYVFKKGDITLDGKQALRYVRMRYLDPKGDLGRNDRQKKVIKAMAVKMVSFSSITKMNEILRTVGNNLTTNITQQDMTFLYMNFKDYRNNILTTQVDGKSQYINDIYYYIVSEQERITLHQFINN
ncbi:LCP family glycopolymer transferase [Bacillus salinus]|uniref:LCP family glycopolymer transferase n=1 Tax=Bacillus sp. HMF5848 TaxID=2495421 RepID=UPI0021AE2E52|nr:LCP family protein [Bacillus sp. HMF5848]